VKDYVGVKLLLGITALVIGAVALAFAVFWLASNNLPTLSSAPTIGLFVYPAALELLLAELC